MKKLENSPLFLHLSLPEITASLPAERSMSLTKDWRGELTWTQCCSSLILWSSYFFLSLYTDSSSDLPQDQNYTCRHIHTQTQGRERRHWIINPLELYLLNIEKKNKSELTMIQFFCYWTEDGWLQRKIKKLIFLIHQQKQHSVDQTEGRQHISLLLMTLFIIN